MAAGDKLYIADKETLDTVKSNTDTLKSTTDVIKSTVDTSHITTKNIETNVQSVKNTVDRTGNVADSIKSDTDVLKSNTGNILSALDNRDKLYYSPDDINSSKLKLGTIIINSTAPTNVLLDVQGSSGVFYGLLYKSSTFNTGNTGIDVLDVLLDNKRVYYSAYSHTISDNYGIITPGMLISGGFVYLPGTTPMNISNRSLGNNPTNAMSAMIYLPKPIKFTNSLHVKGYLSTLEGISAYGTMYYMYEIY